MATVLIPTQYRMRVKQRLAAVMYAEDFGVKPAARHFGLDRRTIRAWRNRWREGGLAGLLPQYPARRARRRVDDRMLGLIKQARIELRLGAGSTRIWLD